MAHRVKSESGSSRGKVQLESHETHRARMYSRRVCVLPLRYPTSDSGLPEGGRRFLVSPVLPLLSFPLVSFTQFLPLPFLSLPSLFPSDPSRPYSLNPAGGIGNAVNPFAVTRRLKTSWYTGLPVLLVSHDVLRRHILIGYIQALVQDAGWCRCTSWYSRKFDPVLNRHFGIPGNGRVAGSERVKNSFD